MRHMAHLIWQNWHFATDDQKATWEKAMETFGQQSQSPSSAQSELQDMLKQLNDFSYTDAFNKAVKGNPNLKWQIGMFARRTSDSSPSPLADNKDLAVEAAKL